MRNENKQQNNQRTYGRFPKGFNSVFAHTQTATGAIKKTDGPKPYWTYSERTEGGNSEIVSFADKLTVGLNGEQLKLLVHYQVLIYQQVKELSAKIDGQNGLDAVRTFYGNTSVIFDVKEYAQKTGRPFKEVNRNVRENLRILEDRTYNYFPSRKDKDGKKHFFEYKAQVLKVHEEVGLDGKKKKTGLIELEVPANYLYALCESSEMKSFYYEVPDAFYKLTAKNQTSVKLASNAVERYNQDRGKDGRGFWKLETAMEISGLNNAKTFKKQNGKEVKVSRLSQNLELFTNAVYENFDVGMFGKEGTFFEIKGKDGQKTIVNFDDLTPLYEYCKTHKAENVYFHFHILNVEDATRKRAKALEAKGEKPPKKTATQEENMDFIV